MANLASVGAGLNRAGWSESMRHWPSRRQQSSRESGCRRARLLISAHPLAGVHPGNFALKMVSGPERGR
jgi:hypothetical protein